MYIHDHEQQAENMERFFIIDGMAIAYRAYFAFISRPLINSKGVNTSAVYGFVSTLERILNTERPDHIAVAFDCKEPTFRHKEYAGYKATRERMPEDMVPQLGYLKRIVEAYRIPVIELPGWEADDVIGTLVKRAEREGLECYMVTADKDYMQLISDHVFMYRPGKAGDQYEVVGAEGVREKFGVTPEQVIDVLGLTGDQSDNIPGVKGIGEKTAIPLVQEYGSIDGIYANIDSISKASIKSKLMDQRDSAELSRRLVTIDTNAPIVVDPHDLKAKPRDVEALRELFTELELKRFLQQLDEFNFADDTAHQASAVSTIRTTAHRYITVRSSAQLADMVQELKRHDAICFDTETSGRNPRRSDLAGLSFAVRPHEAWYVPANAELSEKEIITAIEPLFRGSATIIGQNLKFDLHVLKQRGVKCDAPIEDTMLEAYVLSPEGEHGMDALALKHLNYEPVHIISLIGKGRDQLSMMDVDIDTVSEYAAEDADITLQLAHALRPEIARTGQEALLRDIEFPLVHVLVDMEAEGVRIDIEALSGISKEMEQSIEVVTGSIYRYAGEEFNIGSTKQLGVILFEKLGLPAGRKTQTGYSTDVSVLESLQGRHPIIDDILLYRQLTKLKSTYVDALPRMVDDRTGRVHTSFNQTVAATGRLSSTDPNLQNIPIRTDAGREIRKAFVARDGDHVLMSADYSQIELRLAAEISGDEGMMEAFREGEDIHTSTAMRLFGAEHGDVTPDQRRIAKTTNFGILYGISAFGLAQRLGISNADAKDLIDLYFSRYPKINDYIAGTIASAQSKGYVETLRGRRRYVPDINSKNRNIRMFAERVAINAPIQGSAADMIKIAMIDIHSAIEQRGLRSRMILQVHDELVFDVYRSEINEIREMVLDLMKRAMSVSVPIEVEVGTGESWFDAH
jgi:DNA polymerase-1